jgi:hypothetical protein
VFESMEQERTLDLLADAPGDDHYEREQQRIRAYLNQRFTAETLEDQRRMVDDWVAGLRRRGDIVMVYQPAVSAPAPGTASPGRD